MKALLLVSLLVALTVAVPTQLTYTVGANYVYNVSGLVQNNGYDTNVQSFTPGYYSYMNAFMVMQPIKEDDTSYFFVMNLFGTVVSTSNNSDGGSPAQNNGQSLGDDMYFTQLKTGQIVEIQYYSDDPIYYVDVKLGAINAFQTSIVSVGGSQVVLESDPVGNHSAQVTGTAGADGSLTLTKVFSQVDFSAFPDPSVTPQNMYINAQAVTGIHADGYIMSSSLNQAAVMTNGAPSVSKRAMTNSTGFDMQLSAVGSLAVQFAPNTFLSQSNFAPQASYGYITTTMFEYATKTASLAKARAFTIDDVATPLLSKETVKMSTLIKIGNHFRFNSMHSIASLFENMMEDEVVRDRLFFVITVAQNEDFLLKFGLHHSDCGVVDRAVLAAAQFRSRSNVIQNELARIASSDACPFAQISARSVANSWAGLIVPKKAIKDSDYPYNKTYDAKVTLGGKTASMELDGDVFAGTNLNCNNPTFNFEASASATSSVSLFGYSQQAFSADVVYGQDNGSPLADSITLTVWGNTVYDHAIPIIPCEQGSYPLAHSTPGFSISHTLWVSIIPIVFSAGVALDLTATWGWNVCPTQLSASIDISGDGAIAVTGSTYTDLLLLRAGFELDGTFQTDITPTAYVQGTACELGFEIDANNEPMSATLESYYQWRECKFLFFDCHWGNHNQQTWWNWASPAKDYVIYKIDYQIGH